MRICFEGGGGNGWHNPRLFFGSVAVTVRFGAREFNVGESEKCSLFVKASLYQKVRRCR